MAKEILTDLILGNVALNEYEFVDSEFLKESLRGIYHDAEEKALVATDARVLFVSKTLYDEEFAGRIVNEDGELLPDDIKFPRWQAVVPSVTYHEPYEVDMESLAKAVKEMLFLKTMMPCMGCSVHLHGYLIRVQYAEKMLRFMLINGTKQILLHKNDDRCIQPVLVRTNDEFLMIMPVRSGKDEQYMEVKTTKVNK